jgi:Ser/Thr protein kinase RdoA (MazF antagonist)
MNKKTDAGEFCIDERDPLYRHLVRVALPRAGIRSQSGSFTGARLKSTHDVYLFTEKKSGKRFVGKFFGNRKMIARQQRRTLLNREYVNLQMVRKMGLCSAPYQVAEPLSKTERLDFLLVEIYARGHDLDHFIMESIAKGLHQPLQDKLSQLAGFFAKLHQSARSLQPVDFPFNLKYFDHLKASLLKKGLLEKKMADTLTSLCREWGEMAFMRADESVLIHGDATPTNFIFHEQDGVTAVDLERMRFSDYVYDIGMMAAELKHHFAWRVMNPEASEYFIRHFIESYCEKFPDPEMKFRALTRRNPFYMALCEIRMARNDWLAIGHRKWLIDEAARCLKP